MAPMTYIPDTRYLDACWRRLWLIRDGQAEHAMDNGVMNESLATSRRDAMNCPCRTMVPVHANTSSWNGP
jgi:hypothetical protein